jgi:hypothetical protein
MSRPTTEAELRALPEWTERPPGTVVLSADGADEGVPHGFDNLETSAYASDYNRATSSWAAIASWYQDHLARLGWVGSPVGPGGDALIFRNADGHELWLIPRPRAYGMWSPPGAYDVPGTVFQVLYKATPVP